MDVKALPILTMNLFLSGDPAIDYIGRGGAKWPEKFKKWKPGMSCSKSVSSIILSENFTHSGPVV